MVASLIWLAPLAILFQTERRRREIRCVRAVTVCNVPVLVLALHCVRTKEVV